MKNGSNGDTSFYNLTDGIQMKVVSSVGLRDAAEMMTPL
jgi:hypothetical protein